MIVKHHTLGKIKCDYCEKTFKTSVTLKTHRDKFHNENKTKVKQTESREGATNIPITVANKKVVQLSPKTTESVSKEEEIKPVEYICPICKRGFPSSRGMKAHLTRTHIEKVHKLVTGDGLCKVCGSRFTKEKVLRWHDVFAQRGG